MSTIKELVEAAFIRAAIENLINLKYQLKEDYNNGLIGYYQYEQIKTSIDDDLNILGPEIPIT